jgi:c(7)-type cytochrome triheme protein
MKRQWVRLLLTAFAVGSLVVVILAACGVFFDKGPPPPTRKVRRDLLQEIEELKRQLAEGKPKEAAVARKEVVPSEALPPPVEKVETWEEAAKFLPRDKAGQVDWVKALEAGAIAPRQSLDPKGPKPLVVDLEVDLATAKSKVFSVTFPHEAHTQWLRCKNCHSRIFPLRRGRRGAEPTVVTMAKIKAGRYCGACHGLVSFGVKDECARCHTRVPATSKWRPGEEPQKPIERSRTWDEAAKLLPVKEGGPDWAKAMADGVIAPRAGLDPKEEEEEIFPSDVELATGDDSPGKVTFSHEFHTSLLICTTCHPEMEKEVKKTRFVGRHEDCKACHGKVSFTMKKCDRCHVEE